MLFCTFRAWRLCQLHKIPAKVLSCSRRRNEGSGLPARLPVGASEALVCNYEALWRWYCCSRKVEKVSNIVMRQNWHLLWHTVQLFCTSLLPTSMVSFRLLLCRFSLFLGWGRLFPGHNDAVLRPGLRVRPRVFSAFDSACMALMHSKRSEIAFAVDCSPLSLFWRLMMLHTQPRCHSQENSQ